METLIHPKSVFDKIAGFLSVTVILGAGSALLGWALDVEILKSVFPGFVAMNPATACVFIVGGISINSRLLSKASFNRAGRALAFFLVVVGMARLLSYAMLWDFRIDRILFEDKLGSSVMAPNTALNFLLIGLTLFFLDSKNKVVWFLTDLSLTLATLVSLLAVIGYIYGFSTLYKIKFYTPMAVNTALLFILFSMSVYCLQPERGLMNILVNANIGGAMARRLFPATIILPTLFGGFQLIGQHKGYYGSEFGLMLMVVFTIVIFNILIYRTSLMATAADRGRQDAERALHRANESLEAEVRRRSAELVEANQALEKALRDLRLMQQQVVQQERLRALGQMASGIVHDFNNVLSPILGYTELMLDDDKILKNLTETKQHLATINSAAKDAANIVTRLGDFYRTREESAPLHMIDLGQVVGQVVSLTQPKWKTQALTAGVEIRVETELKKTQATEGNEVELREMLMNLVFNAVDAMPQGGVITISVYPEGEWTVLKIKDTGTGMTPEVRERCLEPFFSTKGEKGSGLGLAMVYGVVQRHQGKIRIESASGKGTSFFIYLQATKKAALSETKKKENACLRPLKVLLVDDESAVRTVTRKYLEQDGHEIETVSDGCAALRAFKKGVFDVVITDATMPEMDGAHLALELKKLDPRQPVILLSGTVPHEGQHPEGVDAVLKKPVTLDELRETLKKTCEHPRVESNLDHRTAHAK